MLNIFVPQPLMGVRLVPFLASGEEKSGRLFQHVPSAAYAGIFNRVERLAEADVVVLPHEWNVLSAFPQQSAEYFASAQAAHKKVILSVYQDDPAPVAVPGVIILRPSAYKSALRKNEIVMPAYVEDLGGRCGYEPLPKGERPKVSFVGRAGFPDMRTAARYLLRDILLRRGAGKQGLYWRRRTLAALGRETRIELRSIKRRNYSAHKGTIELPSEQARREYIESIEHSHFTLAPRGDGNYSLRFYETLSLGRIPILIDTDMSLPLEDRIRYDDFIVRVPWREIDRIGDYVCAFFNAHSDAQLKEKQQSARRSFENYLYMPAFLRTIFTEEFLTSV